MKCTTFDAIAANLPIPVIGIHAQTEKINQALLSIKYLKIK
jgi:hypothetical protein